MSTTPIDPGIEGLPGMAAEVEATFSDEGTEPDWADRDAVVDYIAEGERPYAGPGNFDERRLRALAGRVFDRTNDVAASYTAPPIRCSHPPTAARSRTRSPAPG